MNHMQGTYATGSAEETKALARQFAQKLKEKTSLCLFGELASGKTTFIQGLGEYYGIERIVSPTYIIVRQYPLAIPDVPFTNFYHVDLYRLKSYSETRSVDLEEIWSEPKNLVVIEWTERLEDHLPSDRYEIRFRNDGTNIREITIARV